MVRRVDLMRTGWRPSKWSEPRFHKTTSQSLRPAPFTSIHSPDSIELTPK